MILFVVRGYFLGGYSSFIQPEGFCTGMAWSWDYLGYLDVLIEFSDFHFSLLDSVSFYRILDRVS